MPRRARRRREFALDFDTVKKRLAKAVPYAEGVDFEWDKVVAILVLPLSNTDSWVKKTNASHATQIQLTDSGAAQAPTSKTEHFFPTLTVNPVFKGWRIEVPVLIHGKNVKALGGAEPDGWVKDSVEIRRRPPLNPGEGDNPILQIGYGDNLGPLREHLKVGDYLVFTKEQKNAAYRAFGVPAAANLGSDKRLYVSEAAEREATTFPESVATPESPPVTPKALDGIADAFVADAAKAKVSVEPGIAARAFAALLTKPLVIFTGLAGSGKTRLARMLAKWLCGTDGYAVLAVGADWTSSEALLGYPDALDSKRYVRRAALDLLLRAVSKPTEPHFLVLDEMNLSHVERYFADFLSAMESGEPIRLHGDRGPAGAPVAREGVPCTVPLPPNFFVLGTVNIDETTYMFSPKVLDRANVIEFRAGRTEVLAAVDDDGGASDVLSGRGQPYSSAFVSSVGTAPTLTADVVSRLRDELNLFFGVLATEGAEFGFRTAHMIGRFVGFYSRVTNTWNLESATDAQVFQKLLPRLHGSRRSLEPLLNALLILTHASRTWAGSSLSNATDIALAATEAARARNARDRIAAAGAGASPAMPLSHRKVLRMVDLLERNGFTSFAEP